MQSNPFLNGEEQFNNININNDNDINSQVDLPEAPTRNALERFKSSTRRQQNELLDEEIVGEPQVQPVQSVEQPVEQLTEDNTNLNTSKKIPLKERIIMILLAMFFIWFLFSVVTSSVESWLDVSNPVEKTDKYLRRINNMDIDNTLDNIISFGG